MRTVIWLVLLFAVAVVAALALGRNDGLASFYWNGWRLDVSLNLFLLVLVGSCFALVTVIQTLNSLISLPRRAHEWRHRHPYTCPDRRTPSARRSIRGIPGRGA